MKKLLFLTNLVCVLALLVSCSNPNQNVEVIIDKETVNDDALLVDTTKTGDQTDVLGTVGDDIGTKKDSTNNNGEPHAVIHGSPDQAKLDSIKNAKQKERH